MFYVLNTFDARSDIGFVISAHRSLIAAEKAEKTLLRVVKGSLGGEHAYLPMKIIEVPKGGPRFRNGDHIYLRDGEFSRT